LRRLVPQHLVKSTIAAQGRPSKDASLLKPVLSGFDVRSWIL
jgi:hypothetical protein